MRALQRVAAQLREAGGEPVPLWITVSLHLDCILIPILKATLMLNPQGHSLGSALASLTFFRMLVAPQDLGPDLILRDSYNYGTPRIGESATLSHRKSP